MTNNFISPNRFIYLKRQVLGNIKLCFDEFKLIITISLLRLRPVSILFNKRICVCVIVIVCVCDLGTVCAHWAYCCQRFFIVFILSTFLTLKIFSQCFLISMSDIMCHVSDLRVDGGFFHVKHCGRRFVRRSLTGLADWHKPTFARSAHL